jgi:hypothetical protein
MVTLSGWLDRSSAKSLRVAGAARFLKAQSRVFTHWRRSLRALHAPRRGIRAAAESGGKRITLLMRSGYDGLVPGDLDGEVTSDGIPSPGLLA